MHNDLWVSPSKYANVHFKIQEMFAKDELNKALHAERHLVQKQRSNIRRKKPVPMTGSRKSGNVSPSFVAHQVHCINRNGSNSKCGDPQSAVQAPYPTKSIGSRIRSSVRVGIGRFLKWIFLYNCGNVNDAVIQQSRGAPKSE